MNPQYRFHVSYLDFRFIYLFIVIMLLEHNKNYSGALSDKENTKKDAAAIPQSYCGRGCSRSQLCKSSEQLGGESSSLQFPEEEESLWSLPHQKGGVQWPSQIWNLMLSTHSTTFPWMRRGGCSVLLNLL